MFILEAEAHMQNPNTSLSDNIYIQKLKKRRQSNISFFYKKKKTSRLMMKAKLKIEVEDEKRAEHCPLSQKI
jgi:hypothetical protein